jgi:hypothetical protein
MLPPAPGAVLYKKLFAQHLAHAHSDDTRKNVGRTAGRKPDDQLDWLVRIDRLRMRGSGGRNKTYDGSGRNRAACATRENRVQHLTDRRVIHRLFSSGVAAPAWLRRSQDL